jgi:hypothetical protein
MNKRFTIVFAILALLAAIAAMAGRPFWGRVGWTGAEIQIGGRDTIPPPPAVP